MSQINTIEVGISLETLALAQKGFGMPLITGEKVRAGKPDYVEVMDADDLLDPDIGFVAGDAEYKMAQAIFSQSPRLDKIALFGITSHANIATDLAALRNSGKNAWYAHLTSSREKADIILASNYMNSLEKIGLYSTSDQTIAQDFTPERSAVLVSNHASDYPEAAWFGRCGSVPVGQISWDHRRLNGQKNSDVTNAEQSTLLAANVNLIREIGGFNVTWEGKMMSGQYIDVIIARDYLKDRLIVAWNSLKINKDKVPYTRSGLRMIEATLRSEFVACGKAGILARVEEADDRLESDMGDYQYKLTFPDSIKSIPYNDRASRIIPSITFSAVVTGSINKIKIFGSLKV